MLVMLYCNLFTGPALVMFTLFILWCIIPYSTAILLAYVAWVTYDNQTRMMLALDRALTLNLTLTPTLTPIGRMMPALDRVKQWWRQTSMYVHFRDYFPIRLVKASFPDSNPNPHNNPNHNSPH